MLTRIGFTTCGPDTEINKMFGLMKKIRNLYQKIEYEADNPDRELASYRISDWEWDIERCYQALNSNPQYEDEEFCWELFDALH